MFQEILAENGTKFVIAAVVVLLGLLCLALVLWIIRGRPSSPFIRGGRNRTPRLAVLDAAAIDTRRRLVLVRRDDVEHLIMIGGPTDIVIETRIAAGSAEKAGSVATTQDTPVKAVETAATARTLTSAAAVAASAATAERRPTATAEGVSAMGKVLYSGDDEAATQAGPTRGVSRPATTPRQVTASMQQRTPERHIEDVLEQNRQRVLTQQPAATAVAQATIGQTGQRPVVTPTLTKPVAAVDNPALVSEFEKILEAEMTGNTAPADATRATTSNPTQTAAMLGQAQPSGKSREETEAEMARLLSEIAASRKA